MLITSVQECANWAKGTVEIMMIKLPHKRQQRLAWQRTDLIISVHKVRMAHAQFLQRSQTGLGLAIYRPQLDIGQGTPTKYFISWHKILSKVFLFVKYKTIKGKHYSKINTISIFWIPVLVRLGFWVGVLSGRFEWVANFSAGGASRCQTRLMSSSQQLPTNTPRLNFAPHHQQVTEYWLQIHPFI